LNVHEIVVILLILHTVIWCGE